MKIYIAGCSSELERAQWAHQAVRAVGIETTSTWVDKILADRAGASDDSGVSPEARKRIFNEQLQQIEDADFLWFLAPSKGHTTRSGWGELGIAIGLNRDPEAPWPCVVVSGYERNHAITCEGAEHKFETDEKCLSWLTALSRIRYTR